MDDILQKVPRTFLVVVILIVAIAFIILSNPPHTICDTQKEVVLKNLQGPIFASKMGKNTYPPRIQAAKDICQKGNSSGACYEYFSILKQIVSELANIQAQCLPDMIRINEIKQAFSDGIEVMVRIAWGEQPPGKGPEKMGWFQESEMLTFCKIRNIYLRVIEEEDWREMGKKIYPKLPGPIKTDKVGAEIDRPKALATMSELDIWSQSLFSVRCEQFL